MKLDPLPMFEEGRHFRQLHPTKEGGRKWRYKLTRGLRVGVKGITDQTIIYRDSSGRPWARHDKFGVYVEEEYAWNGCSPKRWYPIVGWVGTPDFKCTLLASVIHDIGYQFSKTEHFPMHKSDVDGLFHEMIANSGDLEIASIYHGAVKRFGKWHERPCNGEFSTLL